MVKEKQAQVGSKPGPVPVDVAGQPIPLEAELDPQDVELLDEIDREGKQAAEKAKQEAIQPYALQAIGVLRLILKKKGLPEGYWERKGNKIYKRG